MHEVSRRQLIAGASSVAALSILGGSVHPAFAIAQEDKTGGRIVYSAARPIFTLDPKFIEYQEENTLSPLINEPLVSLDEELNATPLLATSWNPLDDTTWEISLRENITFTNGEPFNADAVKFTFDQLRELGAEYPRLSSWGTEVPTIEVIDDLTVQLVTAEPTLLTPRHLVRIGIMPPGAGSEENFAQHPIGTGPYLFVEHRQDIELILEVNPNYWGASPSASEIIYRPIPEPAARLVAVQTGEADVVTDIAPDLLPTLESSGDVTVLQAPGVRLGSFNFSFRNADSPVNDVRVRNALTKAIDGNALIEIILAGAGVPLKGPVSAILWGAADVGGFPPYDPDLARAELSEAGYPEGHELVLIYTNGEFVKDLELSEAIQAMLAEVGVPVRIETLEAGAYIDRRLESDWDIAINGAGAAGGDLIFQLTLATGPVFGYSNEATTTHIAEAQTTVNEDQALQAFAEAQALLWEDTPYLWGFTQSNTVVHSNRVENLVALATGNILFHQATLKD